MQESRSIKTLFTFLFVSFFFSLNASAQVSGAKGPIAEAHSTMKVVEEVMLRQDIVEYAKEFLGLRYRSGGRSPSTGFDCSGFVKFLMKEYNLDMASSSASQELQGRKISKKGAKPGDLVFFRRQNSSRVFHVALVLDNKDGNITIIHSSTSRGVVIERINDSSYWRSKRITYRDVISETL
jgi:cell wall-associated NlpC family hydrolase